MSVQLVDAAGSKLKSPSASIVTVPPSLVANVPGVIVSGPGPSMSVSPARMSPVISLCGRSVTGAVSVGSGVVGRPSDGSLTFRVVLPTALLAPLNVSSSATGASLTHVTVTETVAVEPPLSV